MYPTSRDCECVLKSQPGSEFSLRVLDLTLEMRSADECADWLLLQSGRGKNKNTDLNCGEIMMNGKNVTIKSNTLNIHFHSDRYNNKSQAFSYNTVRKLKGFWIYLRGNMHRGENSSHTYFPKQVPILVQSNEREICLQIYVWYKYKF